MSSIDQRVVEARFDNRQFQEGVKSTLGSLNELNKGLNMTGATKGLDGIASATSRVSNGLNVMRVAAYTAIATIAHQATIAAEQFVKSFTVGPLIDGLHEYETQLNSIQTILANTEWQNTSLKDVNGALQELNHYSDKTIYNFSEMARNVGTFTAAGVKLDTSVAAIKGIANLAAVSGSNSQQAATAMYQLSQAISSGTVKLMDWNSVVNAGMGGKVFQDALMQTARVHGVAIDKMVKDQGSFRNTLQEGWLTSKILTDTLNQFTGDMSRQQLKQQGYTEKQIDGIIKMGKVATDAATKVKTFTQLMGTLKEAAGSGWAQTWAIVIGNFNQAKKLWTSVSDVLGGAIQDSAKARNNMLKDWASLGGRVDLIGGIKNAFNDLLAILKPIKDAFREIFPAKTGAELAQMTSHFRSFMANLKIGADTADNLKRTFAGVFAVLDIGWQVIKAGIRFIADLFGAITEGEGSGGFLGATANIGDFLVALDQAIKKGEGLTKFFDGLMHVLEGPIRLLKAVASAIFGIFDGADAASPEKITKAFSPLETFGHALIVIWDKVVGVLDNVWSIAARIGHKIVEVFSGIGQALTGAFGNINYEQVLHTVNTALLGGIVLLVKKFVDHFTKGGTNPMSGFVDSIKAPFTELTGTLQQMQNTLRATTLLQIAAAIGIMTASVIGLATVDKEGLTRALTAMTVMFGQLFTSMIIFQKIGGVTGLTTTAAGLILFATALRVLVSSVRALSELSWEELAKGLVGVTALIGGLTVAVAFMNGNTGGMVRTGAGLILLAAGVKILASAVTDLSGLSWGEMAKGLTGIGALLLALGLFTKFAETNAGGIAQGAGLILLATGIKILASAVADFADIGWGGIAKGLVSIGAILALFAAFSKGVGNPVTLLASSAALIGIGIAMNIIAKAVEEFATMSWGQIAKGLTAMAGALVLIVLALKGIESGVAGAAALLIVAAALRVLAPVLVTFGDMDWGQIAKALVTLAGALLIINVAMIGMEEALPGAAALLVIAGALRILTPVLLTLGNMTWGQIAKGLVTLAGAFAVIGLAALLLTPVIPSILGLGAAIALLGIGVLAIGVGVLAFSTALTALAASGGIAIGVIVGLLKGLIDIMPLIAKAMGAAIVAFAKAIASAAPAVAKAITVLLDNLIKVISKEAPKIIKLWGKLLLDLVHEIEHVVPKVAEAALKMILGVLKAIEREAPKIVRTMVQIMVDILNAIASKTDDLVEAGINIIVHFLNGIAKKIDDVIHAGTHLIIKFLEGVGKNGNKIINRTLDIILDFINGISKAIEDHIDEFRDAGKRMAWAIADGMSFGLLGMGKDLVEKAATTLVGSAVDAAKKEGKIKSPSQVFYALGRWVSIGFANGIVEYAYLSKEAAKNLAHGAVLAVHEATKEFRVAARFISDDFVKGLVGGKDEIVQTFSDAKGVLHDLVTSARDDVERLKQTLHDLRKAREADNKAIDQNTNHLEKAKDRLKNYNDALDKHKKALEEAIALGKKGEDKADQLRDQIKEDEKAIRQTKREIEDYNKAIDKATDSRKKHNQQIVETIEKLGFATNEQLRAIGAYDLITKKMDQQRRKLKELGKEYDNVTEQLNEANQALADAIRIRDDYNKSITDQYGQLPEITADTKLADYEDSLALYTAKLKLFINALATLREMGLDDTMYEELLSKGVDVLPFVMQIIAGGQAAVDELNDLDSDLAQTASGLGASASSELYQAGVDAAQGIVDGLKQQRDAIREEMEYIADIIVQAIADALGIKIKKHDGKGGGKGSTEEAGTAAANGLIDGITKTLAGRSDVVKAVNKSVGEPLVAGVKTFVAKVNDVLSHEIDANPTITPILDLSEVVNAGTRIRDILSGDHSISIAGYVATEFSDRQNGSQEVTRTDPTTRDITFIQNNNSPKALSNASIYRQTKNQISVAKGVLADATK